VDEQARASDALRALQNIGAALAEELANAGVSTVEELQRLGALGAGFQLIANGTDVCANKLYTLVGAIRGVRWHDIPQAKRSALWTAFKSVDG